MQNYLGNKTDVRTAIIEQPAVFERAFLGLIGPLGEKFLADICGKVQSDLGLDDRAYYSKTGDFSEYIKVVSRR